MRRFSAMLSIAAFVGSVLFATSTSHAEYRLINEPNSNDPLNAAVYELENGLRVYITENHESPRFYSEISVRAGSKHDPAETTGLAHYLEHLLFKGTKNMGTLDYEQEAPHLDRITELYEQHFRETDPEKRKALYAEINATAQKAAEYAIPNEIDKLYKSMGASHVNAHTWHEETVYKVGLPANRLRQWAAIESERFQDPVFRIFHTELETVYEEKNRTMDNKDRIINQAVNEALYKVHPYGQQSTIGTVEHLKSPSLVNIANYFNTYYVPNNMAISISGDIVTEEAIAIIDEQFSSWERKKLPRQKKWREKPLKEIERVDVNYQGEEYVMMAFPTVSRTDKDAEAFQLIDMILDNSVAGLINLNLTQQQRVRAAGSSPQMNNDLGAQFLWGVPKDGQSLEDVEMLLRDQLALIKRGEFDDWIVPAIINDFKKSQKASLESNMARVGVMTNSFLSFSDWDETVAEISRMEAVTKKDIVRLANKYFGDAYVVGYRHDAQHEVPSIEKPQIDAVPIDPSRQSAFAAAVLDMPVEETEPIFINPDRDFSKAEDPNGVTYFHAANPLNDLFSLSFTVEFGSHEDNKIGAAVSLLNKSGTQNLSPEALKKEWYKLGTDFRISAGDNQTTVSIAGLDENFEASVKLLMDLLNHPTVDEETLEQLKQIILVQRADMKKDPATISRALVQFNRYGNESVFLRMLPDDGIQALSVDELQSVTKNLLGYEQTVSYVGSQSLEKVRAVISKYHPVNSPLAAPPAYRFLKARRPEATQIYFFDKEMAQAQIRIEFASQLVDETDHTAIELYNSYFAGGMSGIVFQELREARALAYSAGALYFTGSRTNDEDLMVGAMGTQVDKTAEALEAFIELIDDLPESLERFEEAQVSLINQYRTTKTGFRQVIGAVRAWERLDLPIDPRQNRYAALKDAEYDLITAFHSAEIAGQPKLISIVGAKERIDMDRLSAIGNIVEVDVGDIFVE
jgi:predicted Zn-dependent peptidase